MVDRWSILMRAGPGHGTYVLQPVKNTYTSAPRTQHFHLNCDAMFLIFCSSYPMLGTQDKENQKKEIYL